jgi:hypothetical protein
MMKSIPYMAPTMDSAWQQQHRAIITQTCICNGYLLKVSGVRVEMFASSIGDMNNAITELSPEIYKYRFLSEFAAPGLELPVYIILWHSKRLYA